MNFKIWLSPPDIGSTELIHVKNALEASHLAYFGENTELFRSQLKALTKSSHVSLTNTGTAAIHLALRALDVQKGDHVLCQTNTFVATANPILYLNAHPIFIDSESETWNMDPNLLEAALKKLQNKGIQAKAILSVDLYGMPCQYEAIQYLALKYNVPVIEDSAEALGSYYNGEACGTLGTLGIYSFNSNKIITTSGGGAVITNKTELSSKIEYHANQAKSQRSYLWHEKLGYNYKFSNVLAGIGVAQMDQLNVFIQKRRANFNFYKRQLTNIDPKISFQSEPAGAKANRWLSCFTFPSHEVKEHLRKKLIKQGVECRDLWTPLHLQPIFKGATHYSSGVAEHLFQRGLCLPSGSGLQQSQLEEIVDHIKKEYA